MKAAYFPDSMTDAEAVAKMADILGRAHPVAWSDDFDWSADGTTLRAVCWDRDLYKLGETLAIGWGSFRRAMGEPRITFRSAGPAGRLTDVEWRNVRHPYRGGGR